MHANFRLPPDRAGPARNQSALFAYNQSFVESTNPPRCWRPPQPANRLAVALGESHSKHKPQSKGVCVGVRAVRSTMKSNLQSPFLVARSAREGGCAAYVCAWLSALLAGFAQPRAYALILVSKKRYLRERQIHATAAAH